jgi:hypothetical protein
MPSACWPGPGPGCEQWNISDAQIDSVEKAGKADEFLTLSSPVAGVVEEVAVHQGRHVAPGRPPGRHRRPVLGLGLGRVL